MGRGALVRVLVLALFAASSSCKTNGKSGIGTSSGGPGAIPTELPNGATPVASVPPEAPIPAYQPPGTPPAPTVAQLQQGTPLSFSPIAKHADPSVVTIKTDVEETEPDMFGRPHRRKVKGLGTGFVIDRDGVILTNNHVIDEAQRIAVRLSDNREVPAQIVGRDPATDVAVLRIDPSGPQLTPLALGDSDLLDVGDWVVAIGNPFGLSHTVSAGIISAKDRTRDDVELEKNGIYNFLQTDASINPGNSGGPLLNLRGEVVGMNTAIRGGGAQGIGFAIPINMIKLLMPMLLRDGHITRSALGVHVRDVRELASDDKVLLRRTDDKGVVILAVEPGGPAERVGLAQGDVILAFDGQPIDKNTQLQWLASMAGVGRTVTMRISREGKLFDLRVTLGQLKDARAAAGPGVKPPSPFGAP